MKACATGDETRRPSASCVVACRALRRPERRQIGVDRREFLERGIQCDGLVDAAARLGEIAPHAGVAAQIELNGRRVRMRALRLDENGLRRLERPAAPRGIGPGNLPAALLRLAPHQRLGNIRERRPFCLLL